jgi:DNA polymerase-3 subunit alpha
LPVPELKEKQEEESVFAQLIGVVSNVRKMQTKSGGMMLVAVVESVGFDFRIVIFPRDYEKYEAKIQEDMIVVAEGRIKFDREASEISLLPSPGFGKRRGEADGGVKCFSLSAFREMALTRMDPLPSSENGKEKHEAFIPMNADSRYVIDVPPFWTKQDLLDLRDYLEKSERGLLSVWIRIHGTEKDTKFSIATRQELEEWLNLRGV